MSSTSTSASTPDPGSASGEKGASVSSEPAVPAGADSPAASVSSSSKTKKRKTTVTSPSTAKSADEKKWDRVLANRRSAKESRERRKKLLSDLEESVETLKNENSNLADENVKLRVQLQNALASSNRTAAEAALAGAANPHLARSIAAGLLLQGPGTMSASTIPNLHVLAGSVLNQQAMMNNRPNGPAPTTTGNSSILTALAAAMGAPNNPQPSAGLNNCMGAAALPALPAAGLNLSSNALPVLAQMTSLQQSQPQQLNTAALQAQALVQQPQQHASSSSHLSGALSLAARTSPPGKTSPEEQKQQQQQ